jgi:predicted amidohydrolase YtcJ
MIRPSLASFFCLFALSGCQGSPPGIPPERLRADLIVHHAKVVTVDSKFSIAEAVAIKDGRIVAIGSDQEIFQRFAPATRTIDAEGRTVLPGLYDSHVHLVSAGTSELAGPLPELQSLPEVFTWIREKAASTPEGRWIVLRSVFPTRLKEARFPTLAELDAAAPKHPVLFNAGPVSMVNSMALTLSAITKDTPHPPAGQIVKDPATGEPTGMIRNAAAALKGVPPPPGSGAPAQQREAVRKLLALYNEMGITSVADRNTSKEMLAHFLSLEAARELTARITISPGFSSAEADRDSIIKKLEALPGSHRRGGPTGVGTDWVRVGPIKLFLDGGMLNGTAYMREPWPKGPTYQIVEEDYHGLLFLKPDHLRMILEEAARRGWQMTAHTAGEGGMDVLLDAYDAVDKKVSIKDKRWCITHANFPSQRNLEICKRLGVVADVQPAWLWKDGTTLLHVLGAERVRWFQPFKSWLKYTTIGGGSDHMVKLDPMKSTNPWDPWLAMWVTLTRATEGGATLNPEECLTREEAIRLYTINNAYIHHEEGLKGSLEVGKLGDLIILDRDILTCPLDEVRQIRPTTTIVDGNVVWSE